MVVKIKKAKYTKSVDVNNLKEDHKEFIKNNKLMLKTQ